MLHDLAIVGAGPYGLAAASYLRQINGLGISVFGEPMRFWRTSMPAGMLLRSAWSASHIADPNASLTLDAYKIRSGNHLAAPITLERFIDYGMWYQRAAVPDVDPRKVASIESRQGKFRIALEDGDTLIASRVIVASGISAFAARPAAFDQIAPALATHTSEAQDLSRLANKRVVVIGGGQSALESAALLNELGCEVEILIRRAGVHWLGWKDRLGSLGPVARLVYASTDVGPAGVSRVVAAPDLLRKLPRNVQNRLRILSTRPAGARWLRERLRGIPVSTRTTVASAVPVNGNLRLALSDSSTRIVDHVLLGTGYRVNIARYSFLSASILRELRMVDGFPLLGPAFESSVSGLHFLGAPAAWSYGPLMYFISGTKYAASTLFRHFSLATRAAA
jgi:cation diffusion facilitator CzcD-associated flavoprotein CzcO